MTYRSEFSFNDVGNTYCVCVCIYIYIYMYIYMYIHGHIYVFVHVFVQLFNQPLLLLLLAFTTHFAGFRFISSYTFCLIDGIFVSNKVTVEPLGMSCKSLFPWKGTAVLHIPFLYRILFCTCLLCG
jgi:hypothetical protein